jgi:hypothetical protein
MADNNATPCERAVPTDAEIVTVYTGRGHEAGPGLGTLVDPILPPGGLPLPEVVDVERDRLRDASDRESASDKRLIRTHLTHRAAREGYLREELDVEEVGAAEMGISIWLPAPQTSSVDRSLDPGRLRQTRIKLKTAVHVLEMASHMGDHHVPDAELGSGVSRFKGPSSHGGSPPNPPCRPNTEDKTVWNAYPREGGVHAEGTTSHDESEGDSVRRQGNRTRDKTGSNRNVALRTSDGGGQRPSRTADWRVKRQSRIRKEPAMEGITFVGLDAHKEWINVAMLLPGRETPIEWQVPNEAGAIRKMLRRIEGEAPGEVRFCYEAGPCGYALQRQIAARGAKRAVWWLPRH